MEDEEINNQGSEQTSELERFVQAGLNKGFSKEQIKAAWEARSSKQKEEPQELEPPSLEGKLRGKYGQKEAEDRPQEKEGEQAPVEDLEDLQEMVLNWQPQNVDDMSEEDKRALTSDWLDDVADLNVDLMNISPDDKAAGKQFIKDLVKTYANERPDLTMDYDREDADMFSLKFDGKKGLVPAEHSPKSKYTSEEERDKASLSITSFYSEEAEAQREIRRAELEEDLEEARKKFKGDPSQGMSQAPVSTEVERIKTEIANLDSGLRAGTAIIGIANIRDKDRQFDFKPIKENKLGLPVDKGNYFVNGAPVHKYELEGALLDSDFIEKYKNGEVAVDIIGDKQASKFLETQANADLWSDMGNSFMAGIKGVEGWGDATRIWAADLIMNMAADGSTASKVAAGLKFGSSIKYEAIQSKRDAFREEVQKMDAGITKSIRKGRYEDAGKQIMNTTMESLPITIIAGGVGLGMGATLGAGAGLGSQFLGATLAMTPGLGAERYVELSKDRPNEFWMNTTNGLIHGLAESGSESLSALLVGRTLNLFKVAGKSTLKRAAVETGEEAAREMSRGFFKEFGKKLGYSTLDGPFEGLGESANTLVQMGADELMGIDSYSTDEYIEQMSDAFISGYAGMTVTTAPVKALATTYGFFTTMSRKNKIIELDKIAGQMANQMGMPDLTFSERMTLVQATEDVRVKMMEEYDNNQAVYEAMEEEEKDKAIDLSNEINLLESSASKAKTQEAKESILSQAAEKADELEKLTGPYEKQVKEEKLAKEQKELENTEADAVPDTESDGNQEGDNNSESISEDTEAPKTTNNSTSQSATPLRPTPQSVEGDLGNTPNDPIDPKTGKPHKFTPEEKLKQGAMELQDYVKTLKKQRSIDLKEARKQGREKAKEVRERYREKLDTAKEKYFQSRKEIRERYKAKDKIRKDSRDKFKAEAKAILKGIPNVPSSILNAVNRADTPAKVDRAIESLTSFAERAELSKAQKSVQAKVKRANKKMAKYKTLRSGAMESDKAKRIAQILTPKFISKINDTELLTRIGIYADQMNSAKPQWDALDTDEFLDEIEEWKEWNDDIAAKQLKENAQKRVEGRINRVLDKMIKGDMTAADLVALDVEFESIKEEIERFEGVDGFDAQKLLGDIQALEEEKVGDSKTEDMSTFELISKAGRNMARARGKVKEMLESGAIDEARAEELNKNLDAAFAEMQAEREALMEAYRESINGELKELIKNELKNFPEQFSKPQIDTLRVIAGYSKEHVNSLKDLKRIHDFMINVVNGYFNESEAMDIEGKLRSRWSSETYNMFVDIVNSKKGLNPFRKRFSHITKSPSAQEAAEMVKALDKMNGAKELKDYYGATSEAFSKGVFGAMEAADASITEMSEHFGERAREILGDEPSKIRNRKKWKAHRKNQAKIGMIMHLMSELSLKGTENALADGLEVGTRDIFGLMLKTKAAVEMYEEKVGREAGKEFFSRDLLRGMDSEDVKLMREIYSELPMGPDQMVDLEAIADYARNEGLMDSIDKISEIWNEIGEFQRYANLSKNQGFNEHKGFYVPFYRVGNTPKFTSQGSYTDIRYIEDAVRISSSSSREKTTFSLFADKAGGPPMFVVGEMLSKSIVETAKDFSYTKMAKEISQGLGDVMSANKKSTESSETKYNITTLTETISRTVQNRLNNKYRTADSSQFVARLMSYLYGSILANLSRAISELASMTAGVAVRIGVKGTTKNMKYFNSRMKVTETKGYTDLKKLLKITNSPFLSSDRVSFHFNDLMRKNMLKGKKGIRETARGGLRLLGDSATMMYSVPWMHQFQKQYKKATGEEFDMELLNDEEYMNNGIVDDLQNLEEAGRMADQMVQTMFGTPSKLSSRTLVDLDVLGLTGIINKGLNKTDIDFRFDLSVRADSPYGQMAAFLSNFANRESRGFTAAIGNIAQRGLGPSNPTSREDLARIAQFFTVSMSYYYLTTTLGGMAKVMFSKFGNEALALFFGGDEDWDETAQKDAELLVDALNSREYKDFERAYTLEGLKESFMSGLLFAGTGRYGAAGRAIADVTGSILLSEWGEELRNGTKEMNEVSELLETYKHVYYGTPKSLKDRDELKDFAVSYIPVLSFSINELAKMSETFQVTTEHLFAKESLVDEDDFHTVLMMNLVRNLNFVSGILTGISIPELKNVNAMMMSSSATNWTKSNRSEEKRKLAGASYRNRVKYFEAKRQRRKKFYDEMPNDGLTELFISRE